MIKLHLVKITLKYNNSCQFHGSLTRDRVNYTNDIWQWSPMIDRHCPVEVSNMLNSNTERENKLLHHKAGKRDENQYGSSHAILEMKSMHAMIMDMDFWCVAHVLFPCSAKIFIYSATKYDWWVQRTWNVFLHTVTSITRCSISG